jgi:hypothetical protein
MCRAALCGRFGQLPHMAHASVFAHGSYAFHRGRLAGKGPGNCHHGAVRCSELESERSVCVDEKFEHASHKVLLDPGITQPPATPSSLETAEVLRTVTPQMSPEFELMNL